MEFKWTPEDIKGGVLVKRNSSIYMICYDIHGCYLVDTIDGCIHGVNTKEELAYTLNIVDLNHAAMPICRIMSIKDLINKQTV